jgi:glycosyltransferase involved in cell wall biosynthesis
MPRPDVRASLAEAPDDNTGFEIRGTFPVGNQTIVIEAQLNDGSWHELFSRTVQVKRQILPLWLGGGDWKELMFFQMPAHMAYPARAITLEKFPVTRVLPQPVFSIVTPSFNHARFLPETMRSVLEQAGVQCDYVVQDGGSSDGSHALIERVAEKAERRMGNGNQKADPASSSLHPSSLLPSPGSPRLISWSSEPDGGQADAIVKGFAKTSGGADDVMAWINSDDFYLPGALGFVADYFARHPDVDVVYGHRIVVNEESQEIARWFLPKHDPEVLRLNDFVPQETLFWRRRIWDKVGGLDSSFKFAMDWDLLLRFQAAGAKIVRVPYFLACFRVHAAQKTSAQMHSVGQEEITRLRERTHGRPFPPTELETHPRLLRYLRRSAFIEFLWKLGIRAR